MGYPTVICWTCRIIGPSTYHEGGYQHTSHGTSIEILLLDWKPYSLPNSWILGDQIENRINKDKNHSESNNKFPIVSGRINMEKMNTHSAH